LFIFLDVMGFLGYFFNMQCPDCGYICFKQAKNCGGCGFNFKKANTSATSLFRNDSFTIFASSVTPEKEQESSVAFTAVDSEEIAVIDPPENSQENPELESGEFLLNLSDAEVEPVATDIKPSNSDSDNLEFPPLEFGADSDINLEEVEVEGLGLGLEPLEDELPIPATDEVEDNGLEIIEEPDVLELAPEDSNSPIERAVEEEPEEEPAAEIISASEPEDEILTFETKDLDEVSLDESIDIETAEENPELTPTQNLEPKAVQVETEPTVPILDLGEDEISLEIDDDFETEGPSEPPPLPVQIDELDLNLEIDESDGPLSTTNIDAPEIEIEDLGLELEDPDSPPPESEKP
jgi:hypothetical protein